MDKLQKFEKGIGRTCINKGCQKNGQLWLHYSISNEIFYIDPITDTMRKRRLSFFGHIMKIHDNNLFVQYELKIKVLSLVVYGQEIR